MGEEPYYIDKICEEFSKKVLTDNEKVFNQTTFYGKETNIQDIIFEAKQFPFGSEKRVVIVKEAQHIKNIEDLISYFKSPQKQTILVISYKSSIDKRKKFFNSIERYCIVFHSKKLYENQIAEWIKSYISDKHYSIEDNAIRILSQYLGSDLSTISNALNKLILNQNQEYPINTDIVEKHIGISKDYNIFELQKALANKDVLQANQIINHFSENQKQHNIIPIISNLFSFFQKIILCHYTDKKDPRKIATTLKVNPFFINQYLQASKNFSKKQLFYIFKYLKEYDLKSKGVNNKSTTPKGLLKEMIFKILHA